MHHKEADQSKLAGLLKKATKFSPEVIKGHENREIVRERNEEAIRRNNFLFANHFE